MYINEQYHDLPLLETKEYRFISRDDNLFKTGTNFKRASD